MFWVGDDNGRVCLIRRGLLLRAYIERFRDAAQSLGAYVIVAGVLLHIISGVGEERDAAAS
jgi:hypothetical protein